jgi:PAS domain S-box-containing protein
MGQFAALRSMLGLAEPSVLTDAGRKATELLLRETEHAHKLLREQKLELDAVLDNILQGVVMLDADARILVCNKRYLEIYGLSPTVVKPGCTLKDLIQHRVAAGYFHGNVDETVSKILTTLGERKPSAGTTRLANGRVISVFTRPMENGGWLVTHQDVSGQQRTEHEAERMQRFLLTVIENVPSTVIVKDARDLRYVLINKAGEKFYGLPRAQIIGHTAQELFPKAAADAIAAQDQLLLQLAGGATVGTQMVETPANGFRQVMARRLAIRDDKGVPQFLLSVIDDLSDRNPQREAGPPAPKTVHIRI